MIFPLRTERVGSCLAVWLPVAGRRKVAGPCITHRHKFKWKGEKWSASRLSYHLNKEEIPRVPENLKEGLVLHSCDNGWCIEPEHLSLGTCSRNMKEAWERSPTKSIRQSLSKKGKGGFKPGHRHSDEVRAKLAAASRGNKNRLGKFHSEETRKKISEAVRASNVR